MQISYFIQQDRSYIRITGADRKTFLQGLITNDVNKVSLTRSIYSTLLTPQGKFLHDFFIFEDEDALVIDTNYTRHQDLIKRLSMYKLRSRVDITATEKPFPVTLLFGSDVFSALQIEPKEGATQRINGSLAFVDPRLKEMGVRVMSESFDQSTFGFIEATLNDVEKHRLTLGVPKEGVDMIVDKAIPLECGLDELNAIDWQKGCYMGQELTARTKYRGLVRKRLLPVTLENEAIEPMTAIMLGDKEVGSMRSSCEGHGLALLRLEIFEEPKNVESLKAGPWLVKPSIPKWMNI